MQALILDRSFKPTIHRGEDRSLPFEVRESETQASHASPRGRRDALEWVVQRLE